MVCIVGGPGVRTAVKRAGQDDYAITDAQPASALQPPTVKKSAPSPTTEQLDKHVPVTNFMMFCLFLADCTATQYDRLLAVVCPSVFPSVCDAMHCGAQGWCTELIVPACS